MPLPGRDVSFPGGKLGERYREFLIADGLDPDNFIRKQKYVPPCAERKSVSLLMLANGTVENIVLVDLIAKSSTSLKNYRGLFSNILTRMSHWHKLMKINCSVSIRLLSMRTESLSRCRFDSNSVQPRTLRWLSVRSRRLRQALIIRRALHKNLRNRNIKAPPTWTPKRTIVHEMS